MALVFWLGVFLILFLAKTRLKQLQTGSTPVGFITYIVGLMLAVWLLGAGLLSSLHTWRNEAKEDTVSTGVEHSIHEADLLAQLGSVYANVHPMLVFLGLLIVVELATMLGRRRIDADKAHRFDTLRWQANLIIVFAPPALVFLLSSLVFVGRQNEGQLIHDPLKPLILVYSAPRLLPYVVGDPSSAVKGVRLREITAVGMDNFNRAIPFWFFFSILFSWLPTQRKSHALASNNFSLKHSFLGVSSLGDACRLRSWRILPWRGQYLIGYALSCGILVVGSLLINILPYLFFMLIYGVGAILAIILAFFGVL